MARTLQRCLQAFAQRGLVQGFALDAQCPFGGVALHQLGLQCQLAHHGGHGLAGDELLHHLVPERAVWAGLERLAGALLGAGAWLGLHAHRNCYYFRSFIARFH